MKCEVCPEWGPIDGEWTRHRDKKRVKKKKRAWGPGWGDLMISYQSVWGI